MKVAHCLKQVFGKKSRFTKSEINSINFILDKYDRFYKKIRELCENNKILLSTASSAEARGIAKTKRFYYYLKPINKKKVSNFDSLMYTNTISIYAKSSFEAKVLGFILKTMIEGTYDYYNDHTGITGITGNDDTDDDRFLMNEIENMNEPQGLFKNKPTSDQIFETDQTIAFGVNVLGKLLSEPVHLVLKDDALLQHLLHSSEV
jgi:hypothetical protein